MDHVCWVKLKSAFTRLCGDKIITVEMKFYDDNRGRINQGVIMSCNFLKAGEWGGVLRFYSCPEIGLIGLYGFKLGLFVASTSHSFTLHSLLVGAEELNMLPYRALKMLP